MPSPLVLRTTNPWKFLVVDAANQTAVGEPLATDRKLSIGVSASSTAGFTVRVGSHLWDAIETGDMMLKVYDSGGGLRFYGEIVTDELNADGQGGTVAFTCSDLSWRLSKRFTGKDFEGVGTEKVNVDSGQIIFDVLSEINLEQPTGIVAGNKDVFVTRTMTLLWKNVLQLLNELGAIESSYEWTLRYVDGTPPTVYLDLATKMGLNRSGTVFFEYGMGKSNCSGFRRVRSMEQSATRVYGLGMGQSVVAEGFDVGAETVRRLEDQINFSDIGSASMVDALVAAHVAFRARPRKIVSMTPFPLKAPRYGVDWTEGDYVTARATVGGTVVTNGIARIWGTDITLDDLGTETASPRMEPDAS